MAVGLRAVLFFAALHISGAAAEGTTKGADFVRVVPTRCTSSRW